MVIEGIKGQWDDLFTVEAMDTRELDQHTAATKFPSIQGHLKGQVEEEYTKYQNEETLLEVRGENFFGYPYRITGRIEKVNYNMTMMLLRKEDGGYALLDIMMTRTVKPIHINA
jgi:hypothetical protein